MLALLASVEAREWVSVLGWPGAMLVATWVAIRAFAIWAKPWAEKLFQAHLDLIGSLQETQVAILRRLDDPGLVCRHPHEDEEERTAA